MKKSLLILLSCFLVSCSTGIRKSESEVAFDKEMTQLCFEKKDLEACEAISSSLDDDVNSQASKALEVMCESDFKNSCEEWITELLMQEQDKFYLLEPILLEKYKKYPKTKKALFHFYQSINDQVNAKKYQ